MPKSTGQENLLAKFVKAFNKLEDKDLKRLISDYFQKSEVTEGGGHDPLYDQPFDDGRLYDDVAPKVLDFYRELEDLIKKSPYLAMINSFNIGDKVSAIAKVSEALLAQRYDGYEFGDSDFNPHNEIAALIAKEIPGEELVSELGSLDFHEIENQQFEASPNDGNYSQPVPVDADGVYYIDHPDNSGNRAMPVYDNEFDEALYNLASSDEAQEVAIKAVKKAFNELLATYPENQQFSDLGLQIANSENVSIVAKKDLDGKYTLEINQGRLSSPGLESRPPSPADSGISSPEPVSFGPDGHRSSSPSNTSMDSLSSIGSGYIEIAGDDVSVSEDVDLVQVSQALHSATKRRGGSRAPSPKIAPVTTSQIIGGRDGSGRE